MHLKYNVRGNTRCGLLKYNVRDITRHVRFPFLYITKNQKYATKKLALPEFYIYTDGSHNVAILIQIDELSTG